MLTYPDPNAPNSITVDASNIAAANLKQEDTQGPGIKNTILYDILLDFPRPEVTVSL